MNIENILFQVSVWTLPVLIAVTLHEAAHGWVAWKLGDDTAYRMGRVTFNPFRHIDLFMTVLLPAMLLLLSGGRMMFGAAKPVPVNFGRLYNPRRDMILVAAAGPGSNLVLALASAALLHGVELMPVDLQRWTFDNLHNSILVNCLLAVFNMLPVPPLDGSRVVTALLPARLAHAFMRLERWGFGIILAALFILPWLGDRMGTDLNVFWWLVAVPAFGLMSGLLGLVGIHIG